MINHKAKIEVTTFQKAKTDDDLSGDSYFYIENEQFFLCALADGLGSGSVAKESSKLAIDIVKKYMNEPLDIILRKCNEALIGDKRGTVIGLLKIQFNQGVYSYTTVGNVRIMIFSQNDFKRNIPVCGYLPTIRNVYTFHEHQLTSNTTFFIYSDGVNEHMLKSVFNEWHSISETINFLYESSSHDDATMIALRYNGY